MGLRLGRFVTAAFMFFSFAALVNAAPKLRLVTSTVGPVPVVAGTVGTSQTVEAYNAGDGSLSLSVSVLASWLAASVGSPRACAATTTSSTCIPLQFALNTSALPAGTYTGIVTVSDPNAIDAPQTVTVTVRIGGVDVWVAPGSSRDILFTASKPLTWSANTQDGGRWLTLALDGIGSFRFVYPYRIHVQPTPGMAQGTYTGSVVTSGSSVPSENQTIPVTMRVTTGPIAQPSPDYVRIRLAQGMPPLSTSIALNNLGPGSLAIQSVAASGGSWLTAAAAPGGAALTLDPSALAPRVYSGSVTFASNAANGSVIVPVDFEVVAKSAPLVFYQGVVDNAVFGGGDPVSRGDVVSVFGEQFSFSGISSGPAPPLDTQVGGAKVLFNGQPAPLYYSTYGQLAFQVPVDAPIGTAMVQVQRDGITSNTVTVEVAARVPRLLVAVNQDFSIPGPSHPAKVGDTLTIYAIGLGPTSPAVATGAPAPSEEPFARVTAAAVVNFGGGIAGTLVTPSYAGLSPGYAGLYQINVTIPSNVPRGMVYVSAAFPDAASNSIQIAIQ